MAAANQEDDLAVAQNGGAAGAEVVEEDIDDGDEGLDDDDDDMDKISSSPSIEDGGYTWGALLSISLPPTPPLILRDAMLPLGTSSPAAPGDNPLVASCPIIAVPADCQSTWLVVPAYGNTALLQAFRGLQTCKASAASRCRLHHRDQHAENEQHCGLSDETFLELEPEASDFCTPITTGIQGGRCGNAGQVDGSKVNYAEASDAVSGIPYDCSDSDSDDDDDDLLFSGVESRFVDSGWDGACLHNTEDIDFEFVYALHTFVATVEGQANATKGDTMVLLDDSNSYWWLVRVVKDSSIGEPVLLSIYNLCGCLPFYQATFLLSILRHPPKDLLG